MIYVIVTINMLCQALLIWRLKITRNEKWIFGSLAIAIPVIIMIVMRLLIASGTIHGRIAEQNFLEQYITKGTSILLVAGPWLVTLTAIIVKVKSRTLLKKQLVN